MIWGSCRHKLSLTGSSAFSVQSLSVIAGSIEEDTCVSNTLSDGLRTSWLGSQPIRRGWTSHRIQEPTTLSRFAPVLTASRAHDATQGQREVSRLVLATWESIAVSHAPTMSTMDYCAREDHSTYSWLELSRWNPFLRPMYVLGIEIMVWSSSFLQLLKGCGSSCTGGQQTPFLS